MCKNCGVKSCSSCNQLKFIPAYTSALSYDGPGFVCGGKSDVNFQAHTCTPLNQTLDLIFQAICEKNASSLLKEERIEITQADILAFGVTPKLVLSNSAINGWDIHSAVLIVNQGTTDYAYSTPAATTQLCLKSVSAAYIAPGQISHSTGAILETTNSMYTAGISKVAVKMPEIIPNPILTASYDTGIYIDSAAPGEVFTLGDHTMTLVITYRKVTV